MFLVTTITGVVMLIEIGFSEFWDRSEPSRDRWPIRSGDGKLPRLTFFYEHRRARCAATFDCADAAKISCARASRIATAI